MIAVKRRDEDRLSRERQQELDESRARVRAEADAQQAQEEAAIERSQAEAEKAAAEQSQAAAEQARVDAEKTRALAARQTALANAERNRPAPPPPAPTARNDNSTIQRQSRSNLLAQLNSLMPAHDTPRGLVVTIPNALLETSPRNPAPAASPRLAQIASLITTYPGLAVRVDGFTDDRGSDAEDRTISQGRAQLVRDILVTNGVPPNALMAVGYGKARPIASNSTPAGREQNRRVEIVIMGQAIGEQALWDQNYPLTSRH